VFVPTKIIAAGGLGREAGYATIASLAYWNGGRWPWEVIMAAFDAAEDTGRRNSGFFDRLPEPPPNRHFLELLPNTNLSAIGRAVDEARFQQLFEIVPPEVLAAGASDTSAIGGYQRPALGTALFILHYRQIEESLKKARHELKSVAGRRRANIIVLSGGNGAIGPSFGVALARLARLGAQDEPQWRVSHLNLSIQPDGRTPDPVAANANLYAVLKDLSVCASRG
jgi:hypothetical protein